MVSNEEIKRMLDAKRRGVKIDTYKIDNENNQTCPKCKTKNPLKALFCTKCGTKLDNEQQIKCPSCNTINKKDAKYCTGCGEPLKNGDKSTIKEKYTEKNQDEPPLTATDNLKTEPNSNETNDNDSEIPEPKAPSSPIPTSVPEHAIINKTTPKKICPSCKSKNLPSAKFCVVCGEKFEGSIGIKKLQEDIGSNMESKDDDTNKNSTGEADPIEKIKKAKELLDIGAITEEEFESIKTKYLEKI